MKKLQLPKELASILGKPVVHRQGSFVIVDGGTDQSGYPRYLLYAQEQVSQVWMFLSPGDDTNKLKEQIEFLQCDLDGDYENESDGS